MASKGTRDRRAEAGLCSECGQSRARTGWRTCVGCRDRLDAVKVRAKQNGWRDRRLPAHERRKLTREENKQWILSKRFQSNESHQPAEPFTIPVSPVERNAERPPCRPTVVMTTPSPVQLHELPEQLEWETGQAYWERAWGERASEFARRLLQGGHDEQRLICALMSRYRLAHTQAQGIVDNEWEVLD